MTRRSMLLALAGTTGAVVGAASAQRAAVPKEQDKTALAEANAKELLLLMDIDKSGKISKQEWMKFMEAEFDRLDKDKKGELDPKELMESRVWVDHKAFQSFGK